LKEREQFQMNKISDKIRAIFMVALVLISMVFSGMKLMSLQIVEGEENLEKSKQNTYGTQLINAARGEIVDINGKPIVKNKVGFNIIIEKAFFPNDKQKGNEIILRVAKILKNDGIDWIENIPITKSKPYQYIENRDKEIATMQDDNHLRLQGYSTAEDCIDALIEKYEISDEYTDEEKRIIAGIRYEMILRSFSVSNRYTFAEDIPMKTVSKIKELSYNLPGVEIVEEAIRQYVQGDILPHAIGTIGAIDAEEYAELKSEGYGYNDTLGKSGIEKAMEEYLRGQNGTRKTTITNGTVTSIDTIKAAVPGNTVKLTIDSEFQKEVQDILAEHIDWLHEKNEKGKDAKSGAVCVIDVKTGAVLALANYPNYDINDYIKNWSEVAERENSPLINRSINGLYRPGSTFKTVTATAALNEGIITGTDTVNCNHVYTYYPDIAPKCTGWHGDIAVSRALQVSCNIFFYDVGRRTGIDLIDKYAAYYGLGENLGLEIGGQKGYVASPEVFQNFGQDWTPGQVLQASIGQSETAVTPLQMAVQAATIANRGKRMKPYIVDSINSYNLDEVIKKTEPQVVSEIPIKHDDVYDLIEQGMVLASQATFGEYSLTDLPYPVAIKTGTPQKTVEITHSAFIGYYPVGDPQIAFAGMVEEGEYSKYMIRKIIDAYYGYESKSAETTVTISPLNTAETTVTSVLPQTSEIPLQNKSSNVAQTSVPMGEAIVQSVQEVDND